MSTLRERVANFQIAPKYGIRIGEDNADLLIGLIAQEQDNVILDHVIEIAYNMPCDLEGKSSLIKDLQEMKQ